METFPGPSVGMTPRYLTAAVLIGAVSGVAVAVLMAGLSGAPLIGGTEPPPVEGTSPTPSVAVAASPRVVDGLESGSGSTPEPTLEPTARSTPDPSVEPTFEPPGVKLGLPAQGGEYGLTTPIAARGQYITWRSSVGPNGAGQGVDVEIATRLDGAWTGWSTLTNRTADAQGTVVFSWRQRTSAWISIRFALPSGHSRSLQGRWR
jgi:hypothetical protein